MRKDEKFTEAVKLMNETIAAERDRLKQVAEAEEQEPVMVEGETTQGFFCQLMVDPKDMAKIMLKYDYPVWKTLGEDAPNEMWEEMGRRLGLSVVCSVEL